MANMTSNRRAYDFGNCFKTRQEAEQAREKMKEILLYCHNAKIQ
jgi:hypothetical protein